MFYSLYFICDKCFVALCKTLQACKKVIYLSQVPGRAPLIHGKHPNTEIYKYVQIYVYKYL